MKIPSLIYKFCEAVWEYDVSNNAILMHYDDWDPALCGEWMPYDDIDRLYRENYLKPWDLMNWEKAMSPEALQGFWETDQDEMQCYIRFEHEEKGSQWHEIYIQRMAHGRLLLAGRDVKDMQRNATIAKAVMPEFDYVVSIDVSTSRYVMYHSEAHNNEIHISMVGDYHQAVGIFHDKYVISGDKDTLKEKMQLPQVIKALETQKEYVLYTTVKEFGEISYKKLRYSYVSSKKDKILLTRTDIGELVSERKLREKEIEKHYQYLENMPVAFSSGQVLLAEDGTPRDFKFTYCNQAHIEMVGRSLTGKNFYESFEEADRRWLDYYYETAYEGISHVISSYSPEICRHLLVYTFCLDYGKCECVLLDVSEQHFLTQELERSKANLQRILAATASVVFQYSPESCNVTVMEKEETLPKQVMSLEMVYRHIKERALLDEGYWEQLQDAFMRMSKGEHTATIDLRGRANDSEEWKWYRMTLFDFRDGYTHERQIFGFVQNIDKDRSRVEEYRRRAQLDSLTEVFNAGTGKRKVSKMLEAFQPGVDVAYAMFVLDMDDFKEINDSQGHRMGDTVLTEFAQILRSTFRTGDMIYRLGGDEFVVFVDRLFEPEQSINAMMHRLNLQLREEVAHAAVLSCSVGVFVSDKRHTFEECYEMADKALYETKKLRKGSFTIAMDV